MKKPIAQFLILSVFLNPPLYAQEAIEIEIDSAPVEVEIQKPVPSEKPEEPTQQTVETQEQSAEPIAWPEEKPDKKRRYGIAIAVGAIVAGALAALGGGGGGGGSAVDHVP